MHVTKNSVFTTSRRGCISESCTPALERNSGFTLFEILVAMVTMAFLLLLLLNMVDVATRLWRTNATRAEAYREARAAIGVISRDLQNLAATTNRTHFLWSSEALARLASTDGAGTGSAVFFLSWLPPNAQDPAASRSEICQVGYFLAYCGTPASTNPTLNLYRYFQGSDPTFAAIADGEGLFAGASPDANAAELLARHVTGFTLQAFTATNGSIVDFTPSETTPTPDLMSIQISVIGQETAAKLAPGVGSWTNTNGPVIAPVVQTFTTRIRLPRPL